MWTKGTEEQALENVNPTYGEGNGNPLQYSCLENPMDRGAWQATVHGIARIGHDLAIKERENPTWYKGDEWRHWTGWVGGCFGPIKVIFPTVPNILFSDSKFNRQNAGMALILSPSGRGWPSIQTQIFGSLDKHVLLWKLKKKKNASWFPRSLLLAWIGWIGPGKSCALWKHRQNQFLAPEYWLQCEDPTKKLPKGSASLSFSQKHPLISAVMTICSLHMLPHVTV